MHKCPTEITEHSLRARLYSTIFREVELMRLLDWSFGDPDFKGALWMVLSPGPVPHSHMDIRGQDPGVLLHGMQTLGRTPC